MLRYQKCWHEFVICPRWIKLRHDEIIHLEILVGGIIRVFYTVKSQNQTHNPCHLSDILFDVVFLTQHALSHGVPKTILLKQLYTTELCKTYCCLEKGREYERHSSVDFQFPHFTVNVWALLFWILIQKH